MIGKARITVQYSGDLPRNRVLEKIAPSETRMRSTILVRFVPFTRSQD
jgi:hypothetical protein